MGVVVSIEQVRPDLVRLRHLMVNLYLVGTADGWVLIDAGLPGALGPIRRAARERFGDRPPDAVILTHGHIDHVGAFPELLDVWRVPVYAHPLELPFITGQRAYPPPDPAVGGFIAATSVVYPRGPFDFGRHIRPLPEDGTVPGMPGWRWLPTPGHTEGHVSLFRDSDRTLIAGDAFVTTRQESLLAVATQREELHGPPAYFTPDWGKAAASARALAALRPDLAVTGHGRPFRGETLRRRLNDLAARFEEVAVPHRGRYVHRRDHREGTTMPIKLKPVREQVIVITGASSGIGLAAAQEAAARGATVVLAARSEDALRVAASGIEAKGGTASWVVADVGSRDEVEAIARHAVERHGGFDTWVNDAGVSVFGRIDEIPEADHRQLFETNFWGVVHGSLVAAEHLREHGGAIINLGSVASDVALPLQGMYSASKHAIKGFTDAFRLELMAAGAPVSVTLIKPASIDSTFALNARKVGQDDIKLPPPVYAPGEVGHAIVRAAEHPQRDIYVGGGGVVMSAANRMVPRLMDRMSLRMVAPLEHRGAPARNPEGNLWRGQGRAVPDGDHPGIVQPVSVYTRLSMHPVASRVALGAGGVVAWAGLRRALSRRTR